MSKHENKYWLREKEYISLKLEDAFIWKTKSRRDRTKSARESEIDSKLTKKFFKRERGRYHSAPKWYRKMLNRIQRSKSKKILYKSINIDDIFVFEDNYKDAPWYW